MHEAAPPSSPPCQAPPLLSLSPLSIRHEGESVRKGQHNVPCRITHIMLSAKSLRTQDLVNGAALCGGPVSQGQETGLGRPAWSAGAPPTPVRVDPFASVEAVGVGRRNGVDFCQTFAYSDSDIAPDGAYEARKDTRQTGSFPPESDWVLVSAYGSALPSHWCPGSWAHRSEKGVTTDTPRRVACPVCGRLCAVGPNHGRIWVHHRRPSV